MVDRPEVIMPETMETTGGSVEHQTYMTEGILIHVTELKYEPGRTKKDNFAQVMMELTCTSRLPPAADCLFQLIP